MPPERPFLFMVTHYARTAGTIIFLAVFLAGAASAVSVLVTPQNDGSLTISGQVNGNLSSEVAVWIVGPGYRGMNLVPVREDGRFITSTAQLGLPAITPGTYTLFVEDQGGDSRFDIGYDNSTGMVLKTRTREQLFPLAGPGTVFGPDTAAALSRAIASHVVDDQVATVSAQMGVYGTVGGSEQPVPTTGNVRVTVSSARIEPGQEVTLSGAASGSTGEVMVWVIGPKTFEVSSAPVRQDGTFSFVIPSEKTLYMERGDYSVIVADKGANRHPDILYDTGTGAVVRSSNNKVLFTSRGDGRITGRAAADFLTAAFNDPSIDDVYARVLFLLDQGGSSVGSGSTTPGTLPAATPAPGRTETKSTPLTLIPAFLAILLFCIHLGRDRR